MFARRRPCVCLLAWLLVAHVSALAEPVRLYVGPAGNNEWSGAARSASPDRADGPLADLAGARDRLRQLRVAGGLPEGAVVELADGAYFVREAVRFLPEDSGTVEGPVVFRAAAGARPVIHGGRMITGWREEDGVWVADVPEARNGAWIFGELWVNGERRTPARTPNAANAWGDNPPDTDFFFTAGPVETPNADTGKADKSNTSFRYRAEDLDQFASPENAIFVVFHSWETSELRVKTLDREKGIVEFTGPAVWPFGNWQANQRYFVERVREALDSPGEWYLDSAAGRVSYMPFPGEKIGGGEIVAPVSRQLITLEGDIAAGKFVEHLRFEGIEFRYTDFPIAPQGHSDAQAAFSVDAAVQAVGARHCVFERCFIGNTGNYALWFRAGCQDNVLRHSELYDLGAGGVRIGEGGSPATPAEAAERNVIDNNFIREGGRTFRGAVGVWIGRSSYNDVTHNDISHFRYTGVSVGWSWGYAESSAHDNHIDHNRIHHIGLGQLNDMGGVYLLGIAPGTTVSGNVVHDVSSHPALYGGWGLYTDEGSSNVVLENNIVYRTRTGGFHQHYGRENRVANNVFAYSAGPQVVRSREEEHASFTFERNIVLFDNGQLLGSTWKNDNWTMDNNCYWDESGAAISFAGRGLEEWRAKGHDAHSIIADPLFADPRNGDFSVKATSPALALGFAPSGAFAAGLYGEPRWINRPKN